MKKILVIAIMLCVMVSAVFSASAANTPVGMSFATMKTTDLDGNEVTGELFAEHKLTFVNLWATWCGYCLQEMGHIEKMYQDAEFKARGLNVVGILWEDSSSTVAKAKTVLADKGCTYQNIRVQNDAAIIKILNNSGNGIPVSYLVDSTGTVIDYAVGAMSESKMRNFITKGFEMLPEEPAPSDDVTPSGDVTPSDDITPSDDVTPSGDVNNSDDTGSSGAVPEYVLGDVTGDGEINTADAVAVLKHAAEMIKLDGEKLIAADVNKDGSVNTADAVIILKFSAGLIAEF